MHGMYLLFVLMPDCIAQLTLTLVYTHHPPIPSGDVCVSVMLSAEVQELPMLLREKVTSKYTLNHNFS